MLEMSHFVDILSRPSHIFFFTLLCFTALKYIRCGDHDGDDDELEDEDDFDVRP